MSAHGWILTLALVSVSTALADISPAVTSVALCVFGAAMGALLIVGMVNEVKGGERER